MLAHWKPGRSGNRSCMDRADQCNSSVADSHSGASVTDSVYCKHVTGVGGHPPWGPAHPTSHGKPLACVVIPLGEPPVQQSLVVTFHATPSLHGLLPDTAGRVVSGYQDDFVSGNGSSLTHCQGLDCSLVNLQCKVSSSQSTSPSTVSVGSTGFMKERCI